MTAPHQKDPSGSHLEQTVLIWSLYLNFDRPVAIKQILVDGNGFALPILEIKDRSDRHAILVFPGDLGGAVIDVNAVI